MDTIETTTRRCEVVLVLRRPNPAGEPERIDLCRLSPAAARQLIDDIEKAAVAAEQYSAATRNEEIRRLTAEIKVREDRLREIIGEPHE